MARYKVSNKNIYGFKTRLMLTFGVCIPLIMLTALAASLIAAPFFYDGYVRRSTLPEGAPGQCSTEQTPAAASIADMERLSEGFTFLTTGTVLNYDTVRIGGTVYHRITLDSGEKVIARINQEALTSTEQIGLYRLPVGVWREWTPPEELLIYTALTDISHYIDMYGDYTPVISLEAYQYAVGNKVLVWSFILILPAFRVIGVRRRRFAPALLAFRDPLLPRNDLECWCAATFSIWSHSFEGMEGFPLITGARGTRRQVKRFRSALDEQWNIHSGEEGLRTVHELVDKWAGTPPGAGESGWDLCRATQLLGMMYLIGMLSRSALDEEFSRAAHVIQRSFSSWDELVESYLAGFQSWVSRTGRNAQRNLAFRRGIYERLKRQHFSPYGIAWDMDLRLRPGFGGGGRTVVKQLHRSYRDDF